MASIEAEEITFNEKLRNASVIAKPMASIRLMKMCFRLIVQASSMTIASIQHAYRRQESINRDVARRLREGEVDITVPRVLKPYHFIRYGLKDVQKQIRNGEKGIVVFAGDVSPEDIMCHMPALCEENNIPYIYVPSRKDLALAIGINRGCLMALIKYSRRYDASFWELESEIRYLGVPLS